MNAFLISFSQEKKTDATTWEPARLGSIRAPHQEIVNSAKAHAEPVRAPESLTVIPVWKATFHISSTYQAISKNV